jgi:hypothetical protein
VFSLQFSVFLLDKVSGNYSPYEEYTKAEFRQTNRSYAIN